MNNWIIFEKKLNNWREQSKTSWWLRTSSEPPLFKLLWYFKIAIKPPYFANPIKLALGTGFSFGIILFILSPLISIESWNDWKFYTVAGAGFGIFTATWYFLERKIRNLPKWEDL